jgi:hypothetical protein
MLKYEVQMNFEKSLCDRLDLILAFHPNLIWFSVCVCAHRAGVLYKGKAVISDRQKMKGLHTASCIFRSLRKMGKFILLLCSWQNGDKGRWIFSLLHFG